MIIYHFCAKKNVKNILRKGLTIGGVMVPNKKGFNLYSGYNWLTIDSDPKAQSWNTHNIIKYNRCAYRLTIDIPLDEAVKHLMNRDQLEAALPGSGQLFDGWKGSHNWRVYKGVIPPEWIIDAVEIHNRYDFERGL